MIMQQERFFHQSAETIVEVPGLLVQEESVLVPKIVVQRRVQQQSFEMIVEVPVPLSQVEIVRVFTITRCHTTIIHVEQVVEVRVPMIQEEIVHAPKTIQHRRNHHFHIEGIVDVFIEQIIVQTRAGPRRRAYFCFIAEWRNALVFDFAAQTMSSPVCSSHMWRERPLRLLSSAAAHVSAGPSSAQPRSCRSRHSCCCACSGPALGTSGTAGRWLAQLWPPCPLACPPLSPRAAVGTRGGCGGGAVGLRRAVLPAPFGGSGRARGMTWIADAFCKYPCKS
mmetsp:Transcript_161335/g.512664  ORF Transcript_161335/g.512664 Transcript_161335/m.512664 type:complete len:280 (-) Transcript_161335:258-1097(-)